MNEIIQQGIEKMNFIRTEDFIAQGTRRPGAKGVRLDLDFTTEELEELEPVDNVIANKMKQQIAEEVDELITFGDIDSSDPLLKTIDGEAKLGVKFSDIRISDALYAVNYDRARDTIEYTVWFTVETIV